METMAHFIDPLPIIICNVPYRGFRKWWYPENIQVIASYQWENAWFGVPIFRKPPIGKGFVQKWNVRIRKTPKW